MTMACLCMCEVDLLKTDQCPVTKLVRTKMRQKSNLSAFKFGIFVFQYFFFPPPAPAPTIEAVFERRGHRFTFYLDTLATLMQNSKDSVC